MLLETVIIELPLTNNNSGQGRAWYQSHKERLAFEQAFAMREGGKSLPYLQPVSLHVVRCYTGRGRAWDADNLLRGNSKQLIDAMVSAGWFLDDNTKHIEQVVGSQEKVDRERDCIRVEIHSKQARFPDD